ncbi:MAG: prolipoprotein diacylglyceryl transferase [bacterium]|nr:MAG: prolipoprotein diacylglyceryl transferase [bacterium]
MLPNLYIPPLTIFGPVKIRPFGVLVVLAILTGWWLSVRRAKVSGLDAEIMENGVWWSVFAGFVTGHLVSEIFYFPERVVQNPLELLMIWRSLSSFGGFFGGILGALIYFRRKGVAALTYMEAMVFGLVPAWIFGRLGCTIVFDHPGVATDFFLGMADRTGVIRHNLGFYELLLAVGLTVVLYGLKNVSPFEGFHSAVIIFLYAPVRFLLDTLRAEDRSYYGFTPGQYFAVVLALLGAALVVGGVRAKARKASGDSRAGK